MLKGATIYLMNHIFQTSVLIMECIERNWLCKHIKKIRSSQPAIPVLNWVKHQSFPVSIVKQIDLMLCCVSDYVLGHVHIISYRFLFRFTKLYGMMWTHFPSIFMLSISLKTLNIILMCFDGKKHCFWWKTTKRNNQENIQQ